GASRVLVGPRDVTHGLSGQPLAWLQCLEGRIPIVLGENGIECVVVLSGGRNGVRDERGSIPDGRGQSGSWSSFLANGSCRLGSPGRGNRRVAIIVQKHMRDFGVGTE